MWCFCFLFLFQSFFWVKIFEWSWTTKGYKEQVFETCFLSWPGPRIWGLGNTVRLLQSVAPDHTRGGKLALDKQSRLSWIFSWVLPQRGLQWDATGTWGDSGELWFLFRATGCAVGHLWPGNERLLCLLLTPSNRTNWETFPSCHVTLYWRVKQKNKIKSFLWDYLL